MPPLCRKRHVEVDEEYEEFDDDANNTSDDEDVEEFAEDETESQRDQPNGTETLCRNAKEKLQCHNATTSY